MIITKDFPRFIKRIWIMNFLTVFTRYNGRLSMFRFDTVIEGKKVEGITTGTRVRGEKGFYEPIICRKRSEKRNRVRCRLSKGHDVIYCDGGMLVKHSGQLTKLRSLKDHDGWEIVPVSDSFLYIGLITPSRSIMVCGLVFYYS